MSIDNDSQVIDALQNGRNLERVLQALGCDTRKDNGSEFESAGGYIHCPMPNHPDRNESCTVRASQGLLFCQALCETIRPLDLIVEHGKAEDRAAAAKWVEDLLGIKPQPLAPPVPMVDTPALTVKQYLGMRGLPDSIAEKFHLQDVQCWAAGVDRGEKNVSYETGWYNSVLMPTREGRRPRVRWNAPKSKLRWAPIVHFLDGQRVDYGAKETPGGPKIEWDQDLIGMAQFEACSNGGAPLLVVVEGESDVHAMHAMDLPFVIGVPGTQNVKRLRRELLEALLLANGGDTALEHLTVIIWQEPGNAGSQFPHSVAQHASDVSLEQGWSSPTFATLHHGMIEGSPKDPASMLSTMPLTRAAALLRGGIDRAAGTATTAAQVTHTPQRVAPAGAQTALEVLQVDGHHTPPPASAAPAAMGGPEDPDLPAALPQGWSAESQAGVLAAASVDGVPLTVGAILEAGGARVVYDVAGNPVTVEPEGGRRNEQAPLWRAFDELSDPPAQDLAPDSVEGYNGIFRRTVEGWSAEKVDKDGDVTFVQICSPFVLEQVERSGDQILVRVAVPFGGSWNRTRFDLAMTADAGRTCAHLAGIGVLVANRQRPAVTDLLTCMARDREAEGKVVHVPASTGWSGRPGTGEFGGIDVEPTNEFGARMFEANQIRRENLKDKGGPEVAAREWWDKGVMPLISPVENPTACHAAPMLALGAAAAAPLVGPLNACGVDVAPVVWIAGLGGGGKSVTQKLAASIFAPMLASLDGTSAYFANANISQAALSARVDSCRDLPLILDDVTQLPPLPGSTSRGEAARIEAAAALGMLVFNRKPIERATRDGGIRQTKPFRSSAIFSAEVSMSSESSKAVVTAGHRRRIATIEAKPMTDRSLSNKYAETVNSLIATVGGAPGDLHVENIRVVVSTNKLRANYSVVRRRIARLDAAAAVENTQIESLAANVLGFVMLAEVCVHWSFELALEHAMVLLEPYLETGAGAGGATRNDDLTGVEAALRAVDDLMAAHPNRFDSALAQEYHIPVPLNGYLGKRMTNDKYGRRRVFLVRQGAEMLQTKYGVTMQVLEQARDKDVVRLSQQGRMSDGSRVRGQLWILGKDEPDEIDPDEIPDPHQTDPHGLAQPVRVPGQIVVEEPESNMGMLTVVKCEHRWGVPPAVRAHIDRMTAQAAAEYVFTSGRDAMLHAYQTGEGTRPLQYATRTAEGEWITMDFRFAWGQGLYVVPDAAAAVQDAAFMDMVRKDTLAEREALEGHYLAAAEADPTGALGTAIAVPAFPAADDPNWARIDGLDPAIARGQWRKHFAHLYRANHAADLPTQHAEHVAHVKAQRVHQMCRYRHPEWFVYSEAGTDYAGQPLTTA